MKALGGGTPRGRRPRSLPPGRAGWRGLWGGAAPKRFSFFSQLEPSGKAWASPALGKMPVPGLPPGRDCAHLLPALGVEGSPPSQSWGEAREAPGMSSPGAGFTRRNEACRAPVLGKAPAMSSPWGVGPSEAQPVPSHKGLDRRSRRRNFVLVAFGAL